MVQYNYQDREITGKIVYFGPAFVGKSTSLRFIYERVDEEARGKLISVANDDGKLLSFDFLPANVGEITGMRIRFHLVTATGPISSQLTWRRILQSADAIVFVADSEMEGLPANREAYELLIDQLDSCGLDSERIPLVFQINKRDVDDSVSIEEINREINVRRVPWFASIAIRGEGVLETFQTIGRMLLVDIGRRYKEEMLRKRREQIQRSQAAANNDSAEPEEETRTIRIQDAQPPPPPPPPPPAPPLPGPQYPTPAAHFAPVAPPLPPPPPPPPPTPSPPVPLLPPPPPPVVEEKPAAALPFERPAAEEEPPLPTFEEPAAPEEWPVAESSHAAEPVAADESKPNDADSFEDAESPPYTPIGLAESSSWAEEEEEDDEDTASGIRIEAPSKPAPASGAPGPMKAEIRILRQELAELTDEALRMLESHSMLMRRIEELRSKLEKLGDRLLP